MKGKRGEEGLLVHDVAGPAHCVACRALRALRCVDAWPCAAYLACRASPFY